jgi:hypothetical protein
MLNKFQHGRRGAGALWEMGPWWDAWHILQGDRDKMVAYERMRCFAQGIFLA